MSKSTMSSNTQSRILQAVSRKNTPSLLRWKTWFRNFDQMKLISKTINSTLRFNRNTCKILEFRNRKWWALLKVGRYNPIARRVQNIEWRSINRNHGYQGTGRPPSARTIGDWIQFRPVVWIAQDKRDEVEVDQPRGRRVLISSHYWT